MSRFPKHHATEERKRQVMVMAGMGIMIKDICTVMQLDHNTLKKYYQRELETAEIEANVRVAQALYNNATKHNNVTAQVWWTKSRMGWKDSADLNLSIADITMQHLVAARAVLTIEAEPEDAKQQAPPPDLYAPASE